MTTKEFAQVLQGNPHLAALNPHVLGNSEPCQTKRKNKFNAKKITTEDGTFDSKAELARWQVLKYSPDISNLERQPRYILQDGDRSERITFTPDFRYERDGVTVVEDVKGGKATATRDFVMRWKMLRRLHPEIEMVLIISKGRGRQDIKVQPPKVT